LTTCEFKWFSKWEALINFGQGLKNLIPSACLYIESIEDKCKIFHKPKITHPPIEWLLRMEFIFEEIGF